MKTALILGASGLIGGHVLDLLLADSRYTEVRILGRKKLEKNHQKLKQFTGDLFEMEKLSAAFVGVDDLFIAIGTTQAKTTDKKLYAAIDLGIPVAGAMQAEKAGVKNICVVSSMGADPKSRIFYSSLKGQMEAAIGKMAIPNINFVRPSLLLGHRNESRTGEGVSAFLMTNLDFLIPDKYKAIPGQTVAAAMIQLANQQHKKQVWSNDELFVLAKPS
jgi:uncharacterized protein YbjT (DUF2867 family)